MFSKAFITSTLLTSTLAVAPQLYARQDSAATSVDSVDVSVSSLLASASAAASAAAGCIPDPSVLSILETVPTPPADVVSAIGTITDPCHLPSFTGTVEADYKSWTNAVLAWEKSNAGVISSYESSLLANCPLASSYTSLGGGLCSTGAGATATATAANGSGKATGTGAGSTATGTGAAAGSSNAAAPQNTLMAVAAGAAAGLVGILAL